MWNNLFCFLAELIENIMENRPSTLAEGRFLQIAVYFFSTRLFLWNFAS